MTEKGQIYRCKVCDNIVRVISAGEGNLVCCQVPMELLNEKQDEDGAIKHRPIIEKSPGSVTVKVGEVPHPMEDTHYIQWIELTAGSQVLTQFLNPGQPPQAVFKVNTEQDISARSYCNIHGLWKS
jgi:superoxide reductase